MKPTFYEHVVTGSTRDRSAIDERSTRSCFFGIDAVVGSACEGEERELNGVTHVELGSFFLVLCHQIYMSMENEEWYYATSRSN